MAEGAEFSLKRDGYFFGLICFYGAFGHSTSFQRKYILTPERQGRGTPVEPEERLMILNVAWCMIKICSESGTSGPAAFING